MKDPKIKIAVVHDWLVGGGAEKVVYELHKMFPEAPIYTSYATDEWRQKLDGKVVTGYLQRWPFPALRKFVPILRMWWFKGLDLSEYDLVISSTGNGEAKFARGKKHISYCNTPPHFLWRHFDNYYKNPGFKPKWLAQLGLKLLVKPLRKKDYKAAQKVDYFIANSSHIQNDIKKYYGRDSVVIHPPVDVERFKLAKSKKQKAKRDGFVTMGRQVPHKRTDLIVQACIELGLPLKVIGRGPEHDKLVKMAGPSVELLNNVSDAEAPELLVGAKAFIFASFEDFGIAPVEAMAAGTPVIAYRAGGALDYVLEGKTGTFFDKQNVKSLEQALKTFKFENYSSSDIKKQAEEFSGANFRKNISKFIKSVLK